MDETLAVETKGLTRDFGKQCAVDSVDIKVERGSFYGFLGPNGAGKSTTIKMLTGLLTPTSGTVNILGMSHESESLKIKTRIGVVPENLALFDNLTAREYLTFVGRMFLIDRKTTLQRSDELLAMMKLDQEAGKMTIEYSHGMKKKLALAAAILPDPDLLFLDEPFEGVDAVTSVVLRDMLNEYCSRGSTVFLTSHVLAIVEQMCTHVGIISKGELVEQGSLDELSAGGSLEEMFLERLGTSEEPVKRLSWLDQSKPSVGDVLTRTDPAGEKGKDVSADTTEDRP